MFYRTVIRPLLFLFEPEKVHNFAVFTVRTLGKIPFINTILRKIFIVNDKRLEREVFGLRFSNPVGFAAGFDKNAEFYNEFSSFGFSFIEIGTVTPKAQSGNPKPRSFRFRADNALVNRMGFNNKGVRYAAEKLKKNNPGIIIGGNIGKNTLTPNDNAVADYRECFEILYDYVDYFAVNVSCPNIGDIKKLQDKCGLTGLLKSLKEIDRSRGGSKPVLLKISPDLNKNQLDEIIDVVRDSGTDGIIATNTTVSRENLKTPQEVIEKTGNGGLSGQPLKDKSTEIIRHLVQKSGNTIPVIGVGGIMSPEDAIEKLNAGASLVQIYTGFIYNGPFLVKNINRELLKTIDKKPL